MYHTAGMRKCPVICRSMQGRGILLTSTKSGRKRCCTLQYYSTPPPQQRMIASQVSTTEPRLKTSYRAKCLNWLEKDREAGSASSAVLCYKVHGSPQVQRGVIWIVKYTSKEQSEKTSGNNATEEGTSTAGPVPTRAAPLNPASLFKGDYLANENRATGGESQVGGRERSMGKE